MQNQNDIANDPDVFAKNRPLRNQAHHISESDILSKLLKTTQVVL